MADISNAEKARRREIVDQACGSVAVEGIRETELPPATYDELVAAKRLIQERKEFALRSMTPEDWAVAQASFDRQGADERLLPRIISIRSLKEYIKEKHEEKREE